MELKKLASLRKPRYEQISSQVFLNVPVFLGNRDLGPDYVIAFTITKRGPKKPKNGEERIVYQALWLDGTALTPGTIQQAWRQAYAVWKNSTFKEIKTEARTL